MFQRGRWHVEVWNFTVWRHIPALLSELLSLPSVSDFNGQREEPLNWILFRKSFQKVVILSHGSTGGSCLFPPSTDSPTENDYISILSALHLKINF